MTSYYSNSSLCSLANLLIEKLYSQKWFFRKESKLIAIRPLKIGAKSRANHFVEYLPPEGYVISYPVCYITHHMVLCPCHDATHHMTAYASYKNNCSLLISLYSIFRDINHEVELKLHDHGVIVYSVDDNGTVKRVERPTLEETDEATPPRRLRHQSTSTSLSNATLQRRGTLNRLRSMVFPDKKQPPRGIVVNCNDVECIFEFKVYEYCGRYTGGEEEEEGEEEGPSGPHPSSQPDDSHQGIDSNLHDSMANDGSFQASD